MKTRKIVTISATLITTMVLGSSVSAQSGKRLDSSWVGQVREATGTAAAVLEGKSLLNLNVVKLESEAAKKLNNGNSELPLRPISYVIPDEVLDVQDGTRRIPRIRFASHDDAACKERLRELVGKFFSNSLTDSAVLEDTDSFSIDVRSQGMGYVAKETGAITLRRHDVDRGPSSIENETKAVEMALERVAEADLLSLSPDESLDLVGVHQTRYATYPTRGPDGEPDVEKALSEGTIPHVGEYTVYFGRRYRGVPIVGSGLGVRLDAQGKLVAFMKRWRDIEGVDEAVELLGETQIGRKRSQVFNDNYPLHRVACGYFEDSSTVGIRQSSAGVGCELIYTNPDAVEESQKYLQERINISSDTSLSLRGVRRN